MKKLVFVLSLVNLMFISCTKEKDYAEFNLKVSAFTTQVTPFKGEDPFTSFVHQYPINSNVIFTSTNGMKYTFRTGNFTIETFKFGIPAGTYKITGDGTWSTETNSVMSYLIPEQTLTITSNDTFVPITLTPVCCLILIADPDLLIDETTAPRIWNYIDGYGDYPHGTYYLIKINPNLRYLYDIPSPSSIFQMLKKDKTTLSCEPTSACFKAGFIYKILVNSSTTPSIVNPTFKETDLIKF